MKKLLAILAISGALVACNNTDTDNAAKTDSPKVDAPKMDSPKMDAPKMDSPKMAAPKMDSPKVDYKNTAQLFFHLIGLLYHGMSQFLIGTKDK